MEPVILLAESPVNLAVRAALNPRGRPKAITAWAPCRTCRPEERAKWEASLHTRPRQAAT